MKKPQFLLCFALPHLPGEIFRATLLVKFSRLSPHLLETVVNCRFVNFSQKKGGHTGEKRKNFCYRHEGVKQHPAVAHAMVKIAILRWSGKNRRRNRRESSGFDALIRGQLVLW